MAPKYKFQIPRPDEFRPVGKGRKILPHVVKTTDVYPFEAQYLEGIWKLQQLQAEAAYASLRLFIPNSPDIHDLFTSLEPEQRFWTSTGTIVLRKDEDGYTDKRFTDTDGKRVKISHTSIAEHGISWRAKSGTEVIITDPGKLKEYTEIDEVTRAGMYRVAGYDKERGVVTKFNPSDRPLEEYHNAPVWINPKSLFVPLDRGYWDFDGREGLFYSDLDWDAEGPDWRFPLGSMEDVGDRQILGRKLSEFGNKLDGVPGQRIGELSGYVRNLRRELDELIRELTTDKN